MADIASKTRIASDGDRDAVIALWQACDLTRPWNDPVADFDRALATSMSDILVFHDRDVLIASVMVGYDGHRGWVYYLAVHPEHRRKGLGRDMMVAAEAWLRGRDAPKIQLMVRSDKADVIAFYEAFGMERQDVVTLGRRLDGESQV